MTENDLCGWNTTGLLSIGITYVSCSVGCLELRESGYTPMVLEIVKYMRANLIFISFN